MAQDALARLFDISAGVVNVDFNTAGATGKRVGMRNCAGLTVVALLGVAASGTETLTLTLNQQTASTGGSSQTLAAVTTFHVKAATALLGSETWVTVTQAAAATIALTDTLSTITGFAAKQAIVVFEVNGASLADGYKYISVDVADPGAASRIGSILYFPRDLAYMAKPANMIAPLS